MMYLLFISFFSFSLFSKNTVYISNYGWAHNYTLCYNQKEMLKNKRKQNIIFEQKEIAPYTQLIFGWNAVRPQNGFFTFSIQVRDAQTKEWYDYHKMVDWGTTKQCSYYSTSQGSMFAYARLEVKNNKQADGFRIKVESSNEYDLHLIKALSASTADFDLFKPEQYKKDTFNFPTLVLDNIPKTSQFLIDHPKSDVMCSPTSLSMVVGSLHGQKLDPLVFADHVYDSGLNAFGNWGFNTAHAYELCPEKVLFYPVRLSGFVDLYNLLEQKVPVVVSVHGPLAGAPLPYKKGHLLTVIGWDNQNQSVICHDPAIDNDDSVLTQYPISDFLKGWERSRRMAYKVQVLA